MNKGIKYLIVGLVAASAALSSYAANITVNWGTAANTFLSLSDGTYLPTGDSYSLQIGTWSGTPVNGSADLSNFTAWDTETTGNTDGAFTFNTTLDEGSVSHLQIYMVITDTTENQRGIYYVNLANDTGWRFPAGTDTENFTGIDAQDLLANPNGVDTTLATGAVIAFGSAGGDGTYSQLRLALIPEPSSILLVAVGLLGMVGLIRRRS